MRNEDIEGSEDDEMSSAAERGGQSYGPVVTQDSDPVILEMSSFDPGSPSKAKNSLKKVKSGKPSREEPLSSDRGANGARGESKLELFGFDSLVNILG
ncbi:hypothetical protein Tco_1358960, partial [Tanacetum coccineum]